MHITSLSRQPPRLWIYLGMTSAGLGELSRQIMSQARRVPAVMVRQDSPGWGVEVVLDDGAR